MDVDDGERETSEEEMYEYRSKDIDRQMRGKNFADRRNVALNRSQSFNDYSSRKQKKRNFRRVKLQDNQIDYEDNDLSEDYDEADGDRDDVIQNVSFRKQMVDLADIRASEMDANRMIKQRNARKRNENRRGLEWPTQNDKNARKMVLSPRNMNFFDENGYEIQIGQQDENMMFRNDAITNAASERGFLKPRPRSATDERNIKNNRVQRLNNGFKEVSLSPVTPSGRNLQVYTGNVYTGGRNSSHTKDIVQRSFDRRLSNKTDRGMGTLQRPRMQKSLSFDVTAYSGSYDYDDFDGNINEMPENYEYQFQPISRKHALKLNRNQSFDQNSLTIEENLKRNLQAGNKGTKRLSPRDPASSRSAIQQQDLDWNIEYCDDPGILDIPNLPPGYEDFCDIYYNEGLDAFRGINENSHDTFDSLYVYGSGDLEEENFRPGATDGATVSKNIMPSQLKEEESMFENLVSKESGDSKTKFKRPQNIPNSEVDFPHSPETDRGHENSERQTKSDRRASSPRGPCRTSDVQGDPQCDPQQRSCSEMPTKKEANYVRDKNPQNLRIESLGTTKKQENMGPDSQFMNRGFWYHFKSTPEEIAAQMSAKQSMGRSRKEGKDQMFQAVMNEMKGGFYSSGRGKETASERDYQKELENESLKEKIKEEENMKMQFLEWKKEKDSSKQRDSNDASVETDMTCTKESNEERPDIATEDTCSQTFTISTAKSFPVNETSFCCAHSGSCCLHRRKICCNNFSASLPSPLDYTPEVTVNIQPRLKSKPLLIYSNSIDQEKPLTTESAKNKHGKQNRRNEGIIEKRNVGNMDRLMEVIFEQPSFKEEQITQAQNAELATKEDRTLSSRKSRSKHHKASDNTTRREIKKSKNAVISTDLECSKKDGKVSVGKTSDAVSKPSRKHSKTSGKPSGKVCGKPSGKPSSDKCTVNAVNEMNAGCKQLNPGSNANNENANDVVLSDEERKITLIGNLLRKKFKDKEDLNRETVSKVQFVAPKNESEVTESKKRKKVQVEVGIQDRKQVQIKGEIKEKKQKQADRGNKERQQMQEKSEIKSRKQSQLATSNFEGEKTNQGSAAEVLSDEEKKISLIRGLLRKKLNNNEMTSKATEKQQGPNSEISRSKVSVESKSKSNIEPRKDNAENQELQKKGKDYVNSRNISNVQNVKNEKMQIQNIAKKDEVDCISDVETKTKLLSNLIRKKKQQKENEKLKSENENRQMVARMENDKNKSVGEVSNLRKSNEYNTARSKKEDDNKMRNKTKDVPEIKNAERRLSRINKNNDLNNNKNEKLNIKTKQKIEDKAKNNNQKNIKTELRKKNKDYDSSDYESSDYDSSDYESSDYDSVDSKESDYSDHSSDYTLSHDEESYSDEHSDHSIDENQTKSETETEDESEYTEDEKKEELTTSEEEEETDEESEETDDGTSEDEETGESFTDETAESETDESLSDNPSQSQRTRK